MQTLLKFIPTAALVLLLTTLVACGDDGGGDPGPGGNIDGDDVRLAELAAGLADAYCTQREACLSLAELELAVGGPDCVTEVEKTFADLVLYRWREAADDGHVLFDETGVETCLEGIKALPCGDLDLQPEICGTILRGVLAEGSECAFDVSCSTGYCKVAQGSCGGTCSSPDGEGSECSSDGGCERGLNCLGGLCAKPARLGDTCSAELYCRVDLVCLDGTCVASKDRYRAQLGEPCNRTDNQCEDGLSCALVAIEGGAETYACVAPSEDGVCYLAKPDMCQPDEYCTVAVTPTNVTGSCGPRPSYGGACREGSGASVPCGEGLVCRNNVCVVRQGVGGVCRTDGECYSANCNGTFCIEPDSCRD